MVIHRYLELGHNGQDFVFLNWSGIGCGCSWQRAWPWMRGLKSWDNLEEAHSQKLTADNSPNSRKNWVFQWRRIWTWELIFGGSAILGAMAVTCRKIHPHHSVPLCKGKSEHVLQALLPQGSPLSSPLILSCLTHSLDPVSPYDTLNMPLCSYLSPFWLI